LRRLGKLVCDAIRPPPLEDVKRVRRKFTIQSVMNDRGRALLDLT
jgi:hypothetical protein